jgi:hypothetical protein
MEVAMTPATRIAGLLATIEALTKQAHAYWGFLVRRIEADPKNPGAGGPFPDEPPAVTLRSIELVETEIQQLNEKIWAGMAPAGHLYEPYEEFRARHARGYEGPTGFLGERTAQSMKHDYSGLSIWLDLVRSYLNYLSGVAQTWRTEQEERIAFQAEQGAPADRPRD